jgi:serine/threonine protein kinase
MGTLAQAIDSGRFREGEGPNIQHILRTVRHISQAGSPKGQALSQARHCCRSHCPATVGCDALRCPARAANDSACVHPALPPQVKEVAGALVYLHQVGVVHADLTGNNILLR